MSLALFYQIVVIFLLAVVGYVGRKRGMVNSKSQAGLSAIVLNIAVPAFMLAAANKKMKPRQRGKVLGIFNGAVLYLCGTCLCCGASAPVAAAPNKL